MKLTSEDRARQEEQENERLNDMVTFLPKTGTCPCCKKPGRLLTTYACIAPLCERCRRERQKVWEMQQE